ncbi:hypothetical protein [Xanthocytophaga agilis]|uniref:HNH endonuclease n=1 Tax=Xanthocytophaga agilis TaxID=3048010 RepID=A0AAE3R2M8_9BACT|nr:hypothetical protein [Xanthocytophaga agilis]MDJ1500487.1 hypothetical protein [Xanthocytophaga agilis]
MPIDYKDYHPKWTLIRRLILKRASNKCESCGADNHELHPKSIETITTPDIFTGEELTTVTGTKVILTIAHLDHDVKNNRFNNLKALCQACHLNYDREDNIQRKKYGKKLSENQQYITF